MQHLSVAACTPLRELLGPINSALYQFIAQQHDKFHATSGVGMPKAWLCFGLLQQEHCRPASNIDPVARLSVSLELDQAFAQNLADAILARTGVQNSAVGLDQGRRIDALTREHADTLAGMESKQKAVTVRPTPSTFPALHQRLEACASSLTSHSRIMQLARALEHASAANDAAAIQEALQAEVHTQLSIQAWIDALLADFQLYMDVTQPIALALFHIKHGLRGLAAEANARLIACTTGMDRANLQNMASSFVELPRRSDPESLICMAMVLEPGVSRTIQSATGATESQFLSAIVPAVLHGAAQLLEHDASVQSPHLQAFTGALQAMHEIWRRNEEARLAKEAEEGQQYKMRTKSHVIRTEEEEAEEEYARMFPKYDAEFADTLDAHNLNTTAASAPDVAADSDDIVKIEPALLAKVAEIHAHAYEQLHIAAIGHQPLHPCAKDAADRRQLEFEAMSKAGSQLLHAFQGAFSRFAKQLHTSNAPQTAQILRSLLPSQPCPPHRQFPASNTGAR